MKNRTSLIGLALVTLLLCLVVAFGAGNTQAAWRNPFGSSAPSLTVCGPLPGDTTWTLADSPVVVECDVTVQAAHTLTIQPGVVVKFQGTEDELYVYGRLLAVGSDEKPIVFTSLQDDAHGDDTNGDGSATSPAPGNWGAIRIFPGTFTSELAHTWIGYGGSPGLYCNLELNTSQVSVHDNTLAYANGSGIGLKGVAAGVPFVLQDNDFMGNTTFPVYAYPGTLISPGGMQTSIRLSGNTSQGSKINGLGMYGNIRTSVTYTGQADFPLVIEGDVIIDAGAALTFTQGTVIKFQAAEDELYVHGPLTAVGSASQPIVFTSLKDDAHGGDTNGDGSATSPAPGDWGAVRIFAGGAASRIEHTWFGYGGSPGLYCNLELNTSQVSVHDNTLAYANGSGIGLKGVAAGVPFVLQDNDFIGNTTFPVYAWPGGMQTSIQLSGNTSQGSPINGLGMYGNISAPVTYTGQSDFPFVIEGDVIIDAGAALTLTQGSVVKFQAGEDQLFAYGRLTAVGTSDQPIIFTSLRDDAHGGDTNSDSSATSPARGNWGDIRIEAGSSGSRIEHAWIGYGGSGGWGMVFLVDSSAILQDSLLLETAGNGVYVTNASPTIRHNLISGATSAGVYTTNNAQPVLRENVITGNGDYGVYNASTTVEVDAIQNYWGSPSGPYHPKTNPFGIGNRVSDRVLYAPWLERPPSDLLLLDEVLVGISGGTWFHPGETTHIQVFYVNLTDHAIQDAVLVARLPMVATYVGSREPAGNYWSARHEVFWKLGTVNPGESGTYLITLKYLWGLPDEFHDGSSVLFAGSNQYSDLFDIQAYWDFIPTVVTGRDWLTKAEVDALRLSTPNLEALYTQALSEGFLYGVAAEYTFQSGTPQTRVTLLHAGRHAVRFLMVDGGQVYAITFEGSRFSMSNSAGGLDWNLETGVQTYSGAWAAPANAAVCSPQGGGCCLSNCLKNGLGEAAIGRLSMLANAGFTARTCYQALDSGDTDKIADCATELTDVIPIAGEIKTVVACVSECAGDANSQDCTEGKKTCENNVLYRFVRWFSEQDSYRQYYCEAGCLTWSDQFLCAQGERCVEGRGCVDCQEPGVNCHNNAFNKAIDPNALYGPSGDLLAGQWVTYTIEYENMGAGAAEGVFVVDVLSEHFDDSTLAIGNGGEYYAGTRTLSWYIGQLAANGQPGSGGQVSFSVRLKTGLAQGTEVSNQAVVHFPSAPEVTPTNLLVGRIAEIAAIPQTLQAEAGQPLAIEISGTAVGSLSLTYELVDEPVYGVLSGTLPSLIYTSMANFNGPDRFTFQVSAGGHTSTPAEVLIQVGPWSGDVTPPQVLWTDPAQGATGVAVSTTPVYSDSLGVVYAPSIGVQFNEAVSPDSLSLAFTLKDKSGSSIPLVVTYEGMSGRAVAFPKQALKPGETYTVTVSGVEDLLGNVMTGVYTWSFDTASGNTRLFLPLAVR